MQHTDVEAIDLASYEQSRKALRGFYRSTLSRKPVCCWTKWLWTGNISVSEHWLWLSLTNSCSALWLLRYAAVAGHHVANDAKTCTSSVIPATSQQPPTISFDLILLPVVSSPSLQHWIWQITTFIQKNILWKKQKKKSRPSPDTKYALSHCLCSVNTECNPRAVWLKGFDSRKRISPLYVSFFVVLFREDSGKIYLDSSFLENACTVYWFGFNQTCRNAPCCVNVSRRIQEKLKVHLQRLVLLLRSKTM